ncbi:hypothetical protein SNOD_09685 [Streptomyces nodosus]|uniref:Uncharacterized protein n=1 Tax=Streptomyces nodosus TaxID=40318 RepID=A0A0B5DGJ1_9ACTN|nr:hypothetical protein SNOD_09685 [Streptomyces nodosus]
MPAGLSAAAFRPVVFPFRAFFPAALPEGLSFAAVLSATAFFAVPAPAFFPVRADSRSAAVAEAFFAVALPGRDLSAVFPVPEVFPRAASAVGAASDLALLRRAAAGTAVPFRAAPGLPFRAVAEAVPRVRTDPTVGRAAAWAVRAPLTSPAAIPPAAPAPADPPDADCCTAIFFALMAAAPSPSVNSRANRAGTINRLPARGNGARLRFARHTRAARRASLRCAQLSAR